jgi:ammonia channel protein AmtB
VGTHSIVVAFFLQDKFLPLTLITTDMESGRFSLDAATLGMLAGLVMITPAGGFVSLTDSFLLGIIGSVLIYQMLKFKSTKLAHSMLWVDPADVFATHCFGGVVATLLTGFFGSKEAAGFDGATDIIGGVLHDGHWYQLVIQATEGLIGLVWSFGASYTIIALIDCVPGLEVLCTDE